MANTAQIEVKDQDLLGALRTFLQAVLSQAEIGALLVPWRLPMKGRVMPTLIADPEHVAGADPLSPAFPVNGAKLASRLTRKAAGRKIAAVLRPCEIRAFVELVKLKQGRVDDLVIIGIDCPGAFTNREYFRWVGEDTDASTRRFVDAALGGGAFAPDDPQLAAACRVCEAPLPEGADLAVHLFGVDTAAQIPVRAQTAVGEALLDKLGLAPAGESPGREKAVKSRVAERVAARDAMFAETSAATQDLSLLTRYLANCVNCYNCRVACPVCYCRECVFVTDVFDHEPSQYLRWAGVKGAVKMPTDTVFYHLTRLAHMSTACVGCGQCSNACPNDIPVMELFRTIAHATQKGFDYRAGRSLAERPPLSEFREDEFPDVVGLG